MQRAWGEDHTGTAPDGMLGSRMYTQESKAQVDGAERVLGAQRGISGALGRWHRRQKPRVANQDALQCPGAQSSHVSGKFTGQWP